MKKLGAYDRIIEAAKHQLFAKIPPEYAEEFKAYIFANNSARFSIQSICIVAMDIGLLTLYFLGLSAYTPSTAHMIALVTKVLFMGVASYALAQTGKQPYHRHKLLHRNLDIIFLFVYIVGDIVVCFTAPYSVANYMRLFAIPIIAGSITVISQVKSGIILFAVYIFYFLQIPKMSAVPESISLVSTYNFWFVVFATAVFLSASVYSQFVNNFVANMNLKQTGEKYSQLNTALEQEVNQRTQLLQVVNAISADLLGSTNETFTAMLDHSMEQVGLSLGVDRVYIWKNELEGENLLCSQMYEWSGGAEAQQGGELVISVPFPPAWYPNLSQNKCVNGMVKTFDAYEREHLEAQCVKSIIVVPVFILNEFWGFVGFDDCSSERLFNSVEEAILRTVSLLFATSVLRNDMTSDLVRTTELALASSKAKSEFLANISHEIRTPLNAITGMSNIARKSDRIDQIYVCLDRVNAAGHQLLSIINDVLDMSKIEAGKIEILNEPFHLIAMLENVRSIIGVQAEQKQLTLISEISPQLPELVAGDEMRLSQVLINLLSNAVKFTPDGTVHFKAELQSSSEAEGFRVLLSVKDDGIGIAPDVIPTLFNNFEQADASISRKFGGTGLGLAISKRIVEMMHGNITVESILGEGSCFTAEVFLHKPSADAVVNKEACIESANGVFEGYRALLVEDIEVNREIVLALLGDTGLEIDIAENGACAVDAVMRAPETYDIIFMDIQMPVLDGYSATRKIRALNSPQAKTVPIIAMTANAFAEDIERCVEAGMNDHISKPVDFTKLIRKIEQYLR